MVEFRFDSLFSLIEIIKKKSIDHQATSRILAYMFNSAKLKIICTENNITQVDDLIYVIHIETTI